MYPKDRIKISEKKTYEKLGIDIEKITGKRNRNSLASVQYGKKTV